MCWNREGRSPWADLTQSIRHRSLSYRWEKAGNSDCQEYLDLISCFFFFLCWQQWTEKLIEFNSLSVHRYVFNGLLWNFMPVRTIKKPFQEFFITPFADGHALNLDICRTDCRNNIFFRHIYISACNKFTCSKNASPDLLSSGPHSRY